jgi:hypothetical protein
MDIDQFMQHLRADPMYQSAADTYAAQLQGGQNALSARVRQAIVQGGWGADQWTPDQLQNLGAQAGGVDFSGIIDPATMAAAQANPMSQAALLQRQMGINQTALDYQLAARGAGGAGTSGALTVGLQNLQNQYDQASYQGMQSLLGQLGGNISDYNTLASNAMSQMQQTQGQAATNLANLYGPVFTQGGSGVMSAAQMQAYLQSMGYSLGQI